MFMSNHLIGFGAAPVNLVSTLWDRTTGTNIGDFTDTGGLAAAFNGVTSDSVAAAATKQTGNLNNGYVGKNLGAAHIIDKIEVWGCTGVGFQGGTGSFSINIYGSNSLPGGATPWNNGTLLGTATVTDAATNHMETVSTSAGASGAAYQYVWFAPVSTASYGLFCAELKIYTWE